MKKTIVTAAVIAAMSTGLAAQTAPPVAPAKQGLTLTSTAFEDGAIMPDRYTQAAGPGKWVSPQLAWSYPPEGTVSFAIIVRVPDQPLNRRTDEPTHWLIFNIPGTATGLPEGVPTGERLPDGSMQLKNMPKDPPGYWGLGGPPAGPYHHYTFELFALDTKLTVAPNAGRADLENAMQGHILGSKGILVARFHRH